MKLQSSKVQPVNDAFHRVSKDACPSAGKGVRTVGKDAFHSVPIFVSTVLRAFTLIELLVVIAIMAILAALIIPGAAMAKAARTRGRAKGELNHIASMIEEYKTKM